MSLALNRNAITRIVRSTQSAHPGLLLSRGLNDYDTANSAANGNAKVALLERLCDIPVPDVYQHAYARWQAATADPARFRHLYARTVHRLLIGLSASTALETGSCVQHSYGMPMIPGSSIKGCARAFAVALGMPAGYRAVLFGEDETSAEGSERQPGAGSLVWHDAWWMPQSNEKPFVQEVVTVHHQDYYAGRGEASDFDSPVPNAQLAVQGSFYFVIEGDPAWADLAIKLLQQALAQQGIGAKRAAGYGLMERDEQAEQKAAQLRKDAALAAMDASERIRAWLSELDEAQLLEEFSDSAKAQQRFLKQGYKPEDWPLVAKLALELHGDLIASWSNISKNADKKRSRASRFFKQANGE